PGLDRALLLLETVGAGSPAPQLGQQPEPQKARDRRAVDLHAPIQAPAALLGERKDAAGRPPRQDRAELVDAGVEELGAGERLIGLAAHLDSDAGAARRIDFRLRDANHVLIRHAPREVASDFTQQLAAGAGALVGDADRREPIDIDLRIGDALIGDEPARALLDHVAGGGRHYRDDLALEIGERGPGAALAALRVAAGAPWRVCRRHA